MERTCRVPSEGMISPRYARHPALAAPGWNRDYRARRVLIIGAPGEDLLEVERLLTVDGHRVLRMADGWQGYREMRTLGADAIVIAPRLLCMDPMALCGLFRHKSEDGAVPCIFLAESRVQYLQAFSLGAADVMMYPIFPGELAARVRVKLRGYSRVMREDGSAGAVLPPVIASAGDDVLLRSAMTIIARDPAAVSNAGDLSRRMGVSARRLSGVFRERTGLSVQKYVIARKMEIAASLLTDTRLPIADIALRIGYEGLPNFSMAFHRYAGQTAMAYRKGAMTIRHPSSP